MPSSRPATAMAYSQARNCAAERAVDRRSGRAGAGLASARRRPSEHRRWRQHVGAVDPGRGRVLDHDRQHALALLAGGLGDQLLGPVAEPDDAGAVVGQHELVPAGTAAAPSAAPSASAGLPSRRPAWRARRRPGRAARPTSAPASAGGHQPERGQRAVAAADVRVGQEHRADAHLGGRLLQRRARVGDDHEPPAGVASDSPLSTKAWWYARRWLSVSTVPPDLLETTTTVRSSRSRERRAHLIGVGGVEHGQRHAGGPRDHLGGERGAAHAGEDDVVEALGDQLGAERGELGRAAHGRSAARSSQPSRIARLGLGRRAPQGGVLGDQPRRHVVARRSCAIASAAPGTFSAPPTAEPPPVTVCGSVIGSRQRSSSWSLHGLEQLVPGRPRTSPRPRAPAGPTTSS